VGCFATHTTQSYLFCFRDIKFDLSKTIGIDHPRGAHAGFLFNVGLVKVDVTVQVQGRLEGFNQPAKSINALVGKVILVVDFPGRGVGDQYIQGGQTAGG
jgi:hypothetical protein